MPRIDKSKPIVEDMAAVEDRPRGWRIPEQLLRWSETPASEETAIKRRPQREQKVRCFF